jgi:hypothetical protein
MERTIIIAISVFFAISAGAIGLYATDHNHSTTVDSHSGGTNSDGCHTNHKTGDYHCHNPK